MVEVSPRQRERSCGIGGSTGSRSRQSVAHLDQTDIVTSGPELGPFGIGKNTLTGLGVVAPVRHPDTGYHLSFLIS